MASEPFKRNWIGRGAVVWALLLAGCAANAQMNAEITQEETPVRLGHPAISRAKAISSAVGFLRAARIGVEPVKPTAALRSRIVTRHVIASQWIVSFPGRIEIRVSAQTGRILRFSDIAALDQISRAQMYSHRDLFLSAVPPQLGAPPSGCLASVNSELSVGGRAILSLKANGTYIERPGGLDVVNSEDRLVLQFYPRDGRLILFDRSLDVLYPRTKPKLDAASAERIASKASGVKYSKGAARKLGAPRLALFLVPHPKPKDSEYHPEADRLMLVWQVGVHDRELWVDAQSGRVLGGLRSRS